eukprot:4094227-Pleurochrysis_carterae.AAC.4
MQGDASQRAIGLSAILGFLCNRILFFRQRNLLSLSVPTAVATPGASAYVQFRGASATGQSLVGRGSQTVQQQRIDYFRVTAKLRKALDKQVAKREKIQSIINYAMDFLNAVGVHNDTIIVVESHILEVHRVAKSSMDWSSGSAQSHSPTLHAFLNGLQNNAQSILRTTWYRRLTTFASAFATSSPFPRSY